MSDFLGKLAEQTFDTGSRVRPRLPSLFEPTPTRVPIDAVPCAAEGRAGVGLAGLERSARDASPRAHAGEDAPSLSEVAHNIRRAVSHAAANTQADTPDVTAGTSDMMTDPSGLAADTFGTLADTFGVSADTSGVLADTSHAATDTSHAMADAVSAPSAGDTATRRAARHESELSSAEERDGLSVRPVAGAPRLDEITRAARRGAHAPNAGAEHVASSSAHASEAASASMRGDEATSSSVRGGEVTSSDSTPNANPGARQPLTPAPVQAAREGSESASDFLGRLTTRGLDDARGVRPRLGTRTELRGDVGLSESDTTAPTRSVADIAAGAGLSAGEASGAAGGEAAGGELEGKIRAEGEREAASVRASAEAGRGTTEVGNSATHRPARADVREHSDATSRTTVLSRQARAGVGDNSLHEKSSGAQESSEAAPARVAAGRADASDESPILRHEKSSLRSSPTPRANTRARDSRGTAEGEAAHEYATREATTRETARRELSRRESAAHETAARATLSAAREVLSDARRIVEGPARRAGDEGRESQTQTHAHDRGAAEGASGQRAAAQDDAAAYARRVVRPEVTIARPPAVASQADRRADSSARQQSEDDAPSVIRVTIGRVEVRAVMPAAAPAAPAPRPARTGPTLSLEDYLKQRDGGRR